MQFIALPPFSIPVTPIQMGHPLFLRKPAQISQARAKKMQSQMQSQAKSSLTMSSNLLKIMVSRAGIEPATTALKVRCSTD